jgi:hypothetical protein
MAKKKQSPTSELAEKLLAVLQAQRALGKDAYPLTLQRLSELTDPQASSELVGKAVANKFFKDKAIVALKNSMASPVALVEDRDQLAASPVLLELALASASMPQKPAAALTKLKVKLESRIKQVFEAAVTQQIQAHAEKLFAELGAQRRLGEEAYPPSLKRLIELTSPQAPGTLVAKALAYSSLKGKLTLVDAKNQEAPVALAEDRDRLVSSDIFLEFLLRSKRKPLDHTVAVDSLLPLKSDLRHAFAEAMQRRMEGGCLPSTIGWLWIGKKKKLFFHSDVQGGQPAKAGVPAPTPMPAVKQPELSGQTPIDFAQAFDAAFTRLDRQNGAHNFVSLVELRRQLPLGRQAFDAELRKLRLAGRFTLSAAEGRHGASTEEREAGIVEDGSLLLYVSRKTP